MTNKEYFSDTKYLTNSMLGWLLVSPTYFKKQLSSLKEEKLYQSQHFLFGSVVHKILLEENDFFKEYAIVSDKKPINQIQRKFCDFIIASEKIDDETIMISYKMAYSVKGKSDETILKSAKTLYAEYEDYIISNISIGNRIPIPQKIYNTAIEIRNKAKSIPFINNVLFDETAIAFNEKIIFFEFNKLKMKSKIDRFVIDVENKVIKLYDIKTSSVKYEDSNFLYSFSNSFQRYNYHRQLGIYSYAIGAFIKEKYPKLNISEFKFEAYIIAIKSNFDHEIKLISIPENLLLIGLEQAKSLTDDYHFYLKNSFEFSREAQENNGVESLIINYDNL